MSVNPEFLVVVAGNCKGMNAAISHRSAAIAQMLRRPVLCAIS
jgi:hypothetical protein